MTPTKVSRPGTIVHSARIRITRWIGKSFRLAGAVCVLPLVVNVALTALNAESVNPMMRFFAASSEALALWFNGFLAPADPVLDLVINQGLAASTWLVAFAALAHSVDGALGVRGRTRSSRCKPHRTAVPLPHTDMSDSADRAHEGLRATW